MPEPNWGSYLVFPPVVNRAGAGREFKTRHLATDNTDVFQARWEDARWIFNLAGATIHASHVDQWDAFHEALRGMNAPFLMWMQTRRFQIEGQQIGTGNGVATAFQLTKKREYSFGPAQQTSEVIRFPWHNYPPLTSPSGRELLSTEYVRVWVNGVEMPWLSGWDIQREGGLITFAVAPANGAIITASCRYMVLVHGQDLYAIETEGGAGAWEFPAGAELFEPKGLWPDG